MTAKEIIDSRLFDAVVILMDDEIREQVHRDLTECTEIEFMEEYLKRHKEKYGIDFIIA